MSTWLDRAAAPSRVDLFNSSPALGRRARGGGRPQRWHGALALEDFAPHLPWSIGGIRLRATSNNRVDHTARKHRRVADRLPPRNRTRQLPPGRDGSGQGSGVSSCYALSATWMRRSQRMPVSVSVPTWSGLLGWGGQHLRTGSRSTGAFSYLEICIAKCVQLRAISMP